MALEARPPEVLRFGVFELDLRSGELRKQGKRIKLQDQPFQVLAVLLRRPGDVVTREELRSQIWPQDTFVDFDNSLNTAINKLREALGDSADNPRFIETLPRRGYRFLASETGNSPAVTPPARDRLVRGCLEKDAEERWQTAHDVKLQLHDIAESRLKSGLPTRALTRMKGRALILVGAGVVTVIVAILFGLLHRSNGPEMARVVRSYIRAMPNSTFFLAEQQSAGFAISPDGLRLAYVARSADGKSILWVRPFDSLQAQPLAGTEDAGFPFWSPNGRYIGFFAEGKLKKIEASGGPPLTLCDAPIARGGTWNQDGLILFAPSISGPLRSVPSSGGTATPVTTLDSLKGEATHRWPFFLPDGKHFLYVAVTPIAPKQSSTNAIMLGSLDGKESKPLFRADSSASYASGHILFLRQNTLMAQPFDTNRLQLSGEAIPIAESVQEEDVTLRSIFSVSQNGVLAYLEGASIANRELLWMDRSGKRVADVAGTESYAGPRISPDGKRLVYVTSAPVYDIWTYDIPRGVKTRLTFGSSSGPGGLSPVWSPDGSTFVYLSLRNGKFGFYQKRADGSGGEELLFEGAEAKYPNDWSPDGKFLAFQQANQGRMQVGILPLEGERKPYPFLEPQATSYVSVFSPDGKWLAYCSSASGEQQVYVVPFPGRSGKWQVSPTGGCYPRWRRDQKELFYLSTDNKMMAAEVQASGSGIAIGSVTLLFDAQVYRTAVGAYDVTADGQRFIIVNALSQPDTAITLVQNWEAELKK